MMTRRQRTEEDARIFWKFSGAENVWGEFPGYRVAFARAVRMTHRAMRVDLSSLFVLPVRAAVAVLALTRRSVPEPVAVPRTPVRAVRRLVSQVGPRTAAPVRGSPTYAAHMCPVIPGASPP